MTPDERKQPESEELVSLNADDLDDVAGGQQQTCNVLIIECTGYMPSSGSEPTT